MQTFRILLICWALLLTRPGWASRPDAILARLGAQDQAECQREPVNRRQTQKLMANRLNRIQQAKVLLRKYECEDPRSYDQAALLFQHGSRADDFLVARELALLANFRRGVINGMPALAEDRLLVHLGCKQRFGGSFHDGRLDPVQETGDNRVTDTLRLDFFQPPLALAKSKGLQGIASGEATEQVLPRLQTRMVPDAKGPDWLTDPAFSPASATLARLRSQAPGQEGQIRAQVLGLYHGDNLFIPADYHHAAELILENGSGSADLLLANELAALAVMRQHAPAWWVFARSWDRYAQAVGQRPRYGTLPGSRRAPSVAPVVARQIANAHPPTK